jgi:DNA-binding GntR family transcriptional regulator
MASEPVALTRDTPIERPEEGPLLGAGLIERFTSIGRRHTAVVEQVRSRMPRPSETDDLELRPGTPVIEIKRFTYCGETVLETAGILLAGDSYILEYATRLIRFRNPAL